MRCSVTCTVLSFITATLTLLVCGVVHASDSLQVRPGSLVRWQGAGVSMCSAMERTWPAIGDTCWYPVDLLMPEVDLELQRVRNGRTESALVRVGPYPYPVQELQVDDSKVHLSPQDLKRHRAEAGRIRALWSLETPRRFHLPLASPLRSSVAPTSFGNRRILNTEPRSPHSGVDFKASRGTPVLSVAAGTVVLAEEHFFAGNSVFVDHGDGLITMYFHLQQIAVRQGQVVDRGQEIGRVGATGRVTGPHLHFGVRWHSAKIDPTQLLGPSEAVPQIVIR